MDVLTETIPVTLSIVIAPAAGVLTMEYLSAPVPPVPAMVPPAPTYAADCLAMP